MTSEFAETLPPRLGCGPTNLFDDQTRSALARPNDLPRQPPEILLNPNLEWRKSCLAQVGHIPSGYTYLSQLMGHDMGSSVPLDSVPHVLRAPINPARNLTPGVSRRRYNLIENPLTLETIYGAGPTMLSHLYDPQTLLFRLSPRAHQAQLNWFGQSQLIRSLYDERNRDTLMLHELAVAWMQYHNRCARKLLVTGKSPFAAYADARAHVVRVWHKVLREDLLPRFIHPAIASLDEADLSPNWQLDEPTLLIGLFRCFHALPLAGYKFSHSGPHNLNSLMKSGYQPSDAEIDWRVGWDQFLGATPGGPRTGISLSIAGEMRMPAGLIASLDFHSSSKDNPSQLGNAPVVAMISDLPGDWSQKVTPDQLVQDFNAAHPSAPVHLEAEPLARGPLYQVLMVEAQCHGQNGGFGPLGSALLRASVLGSVKRVEVGPEPTGLAGEENPATMLELINLVRRIEE
jgi:hypothetical protein